MTSSGRESLQEKAIDAIVFHYRRSKITRCNELPHGKSKQLMDAFKLIHFFSATNLLVLYTIVSAEPNYEALFTGVADLGIYRFSGDLYWGSSDGEARAYAFYGIKYANSKRFEVTVSNYKPILNLCERVGCKVFYRRLHALITFFYFESFTYLRISRQNLYYLSAGATSSVCRIGLQQLTEHGCCKNVSFIGFFKEDANPPPC